LTNAFRQVLESGWYVMGAQCEAFEKEYAEFCEARECVGVANGLDALVLALRALDIGPGDEVIVPSNTYIATWLAVSHVGATPVPVEPRPDTFNLDVDRLRAVLTSRTRAVMPVHLYGLPADLAPLLEFAAAHGLKVVEDGAQSHGARYRSQRVGAHGDIVAWSFYPGKNLGALGDGGAVTTNKPELADRIRVLRNYGSKRKYHNEVIGYNSRLDELHAALLRVKLKHLDADNAHRAQIARRYLQVLADSGLHLPVVPEQCSHVWHLFVARHPRRDELMAALASDGIGTLIHYPVAPHLQPAYASLGFQAGQLPISEAMHRQVFSLPIGPTMAIDQANTVGHALLQALRRLE
jgi:dTDP-4-amino-4,6-dideoxygalactose transaminase